MDKNRLIAAVSPLFAERAVLLNEQHARGLLARVTQAAQVGREAFDDDTESGPGEENRPYSAGVAVIPIIGVLTKYPTFCDRYFGLCPTTVLLESLNAAVADPAVTAVVLDIDSPGGFVSGTVEFADAVAAANKVKPVTALIRGLCCSGAYWIASQCGKIVSRRESEVGNIGVYSVLVDSSKFYEQLGISMTLVASGQFKGLGADGKIGEDLIADTQRIIMGLYGQFTAAVASGRKMEPDQVANVADGKAFLGNQAKQLGLIDDITSNFETTITEIVGAKAQGASKNMATATTEQPKAGDAPTNDDVRKTLNATIESANAHKSQVREALDAAADMTDDADAETKSLAKRAASALEASSEESNRAAKAWLAKAGDDDEEEEDKDEPNEGGGGEEESKAASYIAAFGDAGAKMFLDGKAFHVAATEFIAKLQADHKSENDALKAENADLKKRLAAMPRGNDAAAFSVERPAATGKAEPKANGLPSGLNKYAANIKLPSIQ